MTGHKWRFAPRFRRNACGWKSDTPIQRIKEALAEIKAVAKKEPLLAADGAVLFLEKLAPAIEQVDSSSGRIGTAVHRAIETLAPLIAKAEASRAVRQRWLDRLWQALQDDDIPYLESLGDHWGELCAGAEIAATWADQLQPTVEQVWARRAGGEFAFFKGTTACMSALFAAGRHDELLALLETAPHKWWHDRRWGAMALAAQGKRAASLSYAEHSKGANEPLAAMAQFDRRRRCQRCVRGAGAGASPGRLTRRLAMAPRSDQCCGTGAGGAARLGAGAGAGAGCCCCRAAAAAFSCLAFLLAMCRPTTQPPAAPSTA